MLENGAVAMPSCSSGCSRRRADLGAGLDQAPNKTRLEALEKSMAQGLPTREADRLPPGSR
jgi:hypothetical protein